MAKFKDFGSGAGTSDEPIIFKLYGEEFSCVSTIQGKALLELVADSSSEDPAVSSAVTLKFYKRVLKAKDWERFNALLEDQEKVVTIETLGEITSWLIEEYTSRPPQQSEG